MTDTLTPEAVATAMERLAARRAQRSEESLARVAELTQQIDLRVQLRQLRDALGLTQTAAAKIVGRGITQADISRIERGEVNPSIERMNRILTALNEYERQHRAAAAAIPLDRPLTTSMVAAAYLCTIRDEDDDAFTHMKLQKILYYAQGIAAAVFGALMFRDPILAWEHGPVVRKVYDAYTTHGKNVIPRPLDFDPTAVDARARVILERVYADKGRFTAGALRAMTHSERPWATTPQNDEIPIAVIREFFVEQLAR